jgi:signal transduction histidine kinase
VFTFDVTERKALESSLVNAISGEQRRIGQELHDGTGQELTGLCMLADNLADALRDSSPQDSQLAHRIAEGLRQALGQVRALSRGLIPVEVDAEGLMAALTELTTRISDLHGLNCVFECAEPVPVEDNYTATQLYRIAQEAITNAIKHGQPHTIRVSLEARGQYLTLRVVDDGVGFAPAETNGDGMGLRIMSYRAGQIGAQFAVRPGTTRGAIVSCTLLRGNIHA